MNVKKSVLIICFMLVMTIIPISQANIDDSDIFYDNDTTWSRTFGGSFDDMGVEAQQTADGGYIVVGETSNSFGIFENSDVWLIKTDDKGNMEWEQTFGRGEDDQGSYVVQTSDGGYIITGNTRSYGNGKTDAWLIKTDENGNMIWDKTFGYSDFDSGSEVIQTKDGGYILVGQVNTSGGGLGDVWIIKVDSDGNKLWDKSYGGKGHNYGDSIQQTPDGGYIILGSSWIPDETNSYDVWLIKTDSYGEMLWDRKYHGTDSDHGWSLQLTSEGDLIVLGMTNSGAGFADVWLFKADDTGKMLWDKTFGGDGQNRGYSVRQTSDGGFIVAGDTNKNRRMEALLIKTDSNGEMEWNKTYGGLGNDIFFSVRQTDDDGYILTGYESTLRYSDLWLVKTDSEGNAPKKIIKNLESEIEKEEIKDIDSDESKKLVHIIGKCYSYGFGGYMHIGRLWWCPNPKFSVDFSFTPEDLYIFRVNGKNQAYNEDSSQIDISMVKFFGLAPTLINFVFMPPDIIHIYGICSEVNIRERE
ncbi:hypothetical protein ACFL1L_01570 [Thermoplasmatota archaeon]